MFIAPKIFISNRESLAGLASSPVARLLSLPVVVVQSLLSPITGLASLTANQLANALVDARANISAHYDLGNDMFKGRFS